MRFMAVARASEIGVMGSLQYQRGFNSELPAPLVLAHTAYYYAPYYMRLV